MDFTESTSKRSHSSELSDEEVITSKPEGRPSKKGRPSEKARDSSSEIPVSNRFACLEAAVTDADESSDSSVAMPCPTDSTPGSLSKQPVVESVVTDQRSRARSSSSQKSNCEEINRSRSPRKNTDQKDNKGKFKKIVY